MIRARIEYLSGSLLYEMSSAPSKSSSLSVDAAAICAALQSVVEAINNLATVHASA